jgi:hypothetical protein
VKGVDIMEPIKALIISSTYRERVIELIEIFNILLKLTCAAENE